MAELDKTIFDNKKLSDLLKEAYSNHKTRDKQLRVLIDELKPLVENIGDATLVVPLIKEYLDIAVKNDDLFIKMAALAQKSAQIQGVSSGDLGITEEEKRQLLKDAKLLVDKNPDNK